MTCQCCTPTTEKEPERRAAQTPEHDADAAGGCGPDCGCGAPVDTDRERPPAAEEPVRAADAGAVS